MTDRERLIKALDAYIDSAGPIWGHDGGEGILAAIHAAGYAIVPLQADELMADIIEAAIAEGFSGEEAYHRVVGASDLAAPVQTEDK